LVPIPVDADGVRVEVLEDLAAAGNLRAVYTTPHHQHPTTVTLSPGRRLPLLQLAKEKRVAIIEDDYAHQIHSDGRPIPPMASVDTAGVVVYVGTLSKILAPGLRIGNIVAPEKLIERMAVKRFVIGVQGDLAIEEAVAELLEDGEVSRHVRRLRRIYHLR